MSSYTFPADFLWGTATSAYQIEGAPHEDGRAPSIWDVFTRSPGAIEDHSTGDVACDHYHRWHEDLDLLQELGVDAYRFSIAWPRILPDGDGPVNEAGLEFYDALVDSLLDAGIKPVATLYHWDLPQALQDQGGWPNRSTAEAFATYADVVSRRLGDRVTHWITHNEPWVAAYLGHYHGIHAPGITDLSAATQAAHHLLLSHGLAVPALRANAPDAEIGITLNLSPVRPANSSSASAEAVRRQDGFVNRWFLDPLYGRGYPRDTMSLFGEDAPAVRPEDLDRIARPIDFLGVNYYRPTYVRADPDDQLGVETLSPDALARRGFTITEMGWPVDPSGLQDLLHRLSADYAPPSIYITENGAAFPDQRSGTRIADEERVNFFHGHLRAVHAALDNGVPLDGYFAWSLLDNFEWERGYTKRFGLVYVDYDNQERFPKASYYWYRSVIERNAIVAVRS
jgi:beta-glucosidase